MQLNQFLMATLLFAISPFFLSCSSDDDGYQRGNWVSRSVFDGIPRSNAVGFVIDNMGYMGTGYNGDEYMSDFWQYNIAGDYWVQKADFPGTPRTSASGFALNGKGYLGIGYDGTSTLSDFWEYNPSSNTWAQKADFGGGVRRAATAFAIDGYGYIGTGYDGGNDRKDFWKYDAATDEWTELVGFGGNKRRDATAFVIDDRVYLGTGVTNGIYQTDFWEFNPATNAWTQKNRLDKEDDYTIVRSNAVGLSINGMGYVATGFRDSALNTIWEYNPSTDEWEQITRLEGIIRQDAVAFSTLSQGFVLLGRSGSLYLDDIYELFPQDEYNEDD